MTRDPYTVLGLTPSASADEVKVAYRKLAKKYHPDLNPGDKEAERKMQEINEAYDAIVNHKYDPNAQNQSSSSSYGQSSSYGSGYGGQQSYGQQGGYRQQQWGYSDPFEGFRGFWGAYGQQQQRQYSGRANESADLRAARNYINSGRYYEAVNVLNQIGVHDAYWYYLSALANEGLGNRINALENARRAAQMEPDNSDYAGLLQRLEYANGAGESYGRNFHMPDIRTNGLLWCCVANAVLNLCCRGGGGFFC